MSKFDLKAIYIYMYIARICISRVAIYIIISSKSSGGRWIFATKIYFAQQRDYGCVNSGNNTQPSIGINSRKYSRVTPTINKRNTLMVWNCHAMYIEMWLVGWAVRRRSALSTCRVNLCNLLCLCVGSYRCVFNNRVSFIMFMTVSKEFFQICIITNWQFGFNPSITPNQRTAGPPNRHPAEQKQHCQQQFVSLEPSCT